MKKLILKLALVLMAISLNTVAQDDNCYFKYQKKFDDRGAFEVENGWHSDIVVTFRRGLYAECYTAKVEVKEGVVSQIHIRNSDGSYERYNKKFKNNMDQNITIINGISRFEGLKLTMKKIYFLFIFSFFISVFSQQKLQSQSDFYFYENKGQIIDQKGNANSKVKYLFNSGGLNVQIKKEGFSYDVYEVEKTKKKKSKVENSLTVIDRKPKDEFDYKFKFHRVDIDFLDANKNPEIIAEGKSTDYENYYNIPGKPEGVTEVHRYQKITYKNIYPNIDLVFMDIKMPILDGYKAFKKVKKIRPNLPVIAQTAFSSAEDKEKINNAGFADYITKPLNKEKIFELLENIFAQKETATSNTEKNNEGFLF